VNRVFLDFWLQRNKVLFKQEPLSYMTEANWSNAGEMLIIDSDFAILGIALGSGLLDPGSLDPGSLDPGNLDPGNLDPGHRPRGWLWWGKKWTAALLVKRTSAAVPTLWAVKACSPGEAWMGMSKTSRVPTALPFKGWTSMAAIFAAFRPPVLLVFTLATAPSHQSPLFIFVRKSSPQGNVGCCPLLSIWGLPTDPAWLHCTYCPDCWAHGVGQPEGSFCGWTKACWTRGSV